MPWMILSQSVFRTTAMLSFRRFFDAFLDFFTPDCGEYQNFSVDGTAVGICLFGIYIGLLIAVMVAAFERGVHADFVGGLIDLGADRQETAVTLAELGFLRNRSVRGEFRDGVGLSRYVRCAEEEIFLGNGEATVTAEPEGGEATVTAKPEGEEAAVTAEPEGGEAAVTAEPEGEEAAVTAKPEGEETAVTAESEGGEAADSEAKTRPPYCHNFQTEHFYLPEENRAAAEVRYHIGKSPARGLIFAVVALTAAYLLLVVCSPALLTLLDNCLGMLKS